MWINLREAAISLWVLWDKNVWRRNKHNKQTNQLIIDAYNKLKLNRDKKLREKKHNTTKYTTNKLRLLKYNTQVERIRKDIKKREILRRIHYLTKRYNQIRSPNRYKEILKKQIILLRRKLNRRTVNIEKRKLNKRTVNIENKDKNNYLKKLEKYKSYIIKYATKYKLKKPEELARLIYLESWWNPHAKNGSCYWLWQINQKNTQPYIDKQIWKRRRNKNNISYQIESTAYYFSEMLKLAKWSYPIATVFYNLWPWASRYWNKKKYDRRWRIVVQDIYTIARKNSVITRNIPKKEWHRLITRNTYMAAAIVYYSKNKIKYNEALKMISKFFRKK